MADETSLNSIQGDVFNTDLMAGVQRVVAYRCKERYDAYQRNVDWLRTGQTGWWPVAEEQEFGGVVILLDSAVHKKRIEVWAGRTVGITSGRLEKRSDGLWRLGVEGEFRYMGWVPVGKVSAFLGKGMGVTGVYIDASLKKSFKPKKIKRGFNRENTGDRALVVPGSYTPDDLHARVVNSLERWLKKQKYKDSDNQSGDHDLHAFSSEGVPELFEVKSGASQGEVCTALGQLMIYELGTKPSRKIMVLPEAQWAARAWQDTLEKLGIGLMTFVPTEDDFAFTRVSMPAFPPKFAPRQSRP